MQEKEEATWATEAHEQTWRKKMFKELEVQHPNHRKAISKALYMLRKSPQWLLWSGEEKIRESEATVARINSNPSSKPHRASDNNKTITHKSSPRQAKRNRSSMDSSVDWSRGNTLFEYDSVNVQLYSSSDMLDSYGEVPMESRPRESGVGDSKKRKGSRTVTGVLRDFTKPFEFPYL